MTKINRREFLRLVAVGAGSAVAAEILAACGAGAGPAEPKAPTSTPPPDAAYLAVARGGTDPEALTRRSVQALGGLERFIAKGSRVVIKPNICTAGRSYEFAATTNPWVVGALVKMSLEAGAGKVIVLDYPFDGTSGQAYTDSGIRDQVLASGGEMEEISMVKFVSTSLPDAKVMTQADIYDTVLGADTLINVPIAKDHGLARISMGMKNLLGVIRDRPVCHGDLAGYLPDLAGFLRPALTVVDCVRILTANGPTGGNLSDVQTLNTVVASADFVAADAYSTSFFGLKPADLPYVRAAGERGLGLTDLTNVKVEEITVGG